MQSRMNNGQRLRRGQAGPRHDAPLWPLYKLVKGGVLMARKVPWVDPDPVSKTGTPEQSRCLCGE
jgi:hypothetical protein